MPAASSLPPDQELTLLDDLRGTNLAAAEHALRQLSLAYYDVLLGFAISYTASVDVAEDVLQTVFIRLWNHRQEIDVTRSLRPWLFFTVRNASLDHQRRARAAEKYESHAISWTDHSPAPDTSVELTELDHAVQQAVRELPPRCREIFMLNRASGLSYTEISEVLGVSLSTVKTQMGRAVRVLLEKAAPFLAGVFVLSR